MRSSYHRIGACACALALLVPAAASAMPPTDPPAAHGGLTVAGDTKNDLQNKQDPNAGGLTVAGDTKNDLQNKQDPNAGGLTAPARGTQSVDAVGSMTAKQLAAAYGTNNKPSATTPAQASVVSATNDDGTNGWRIAAVVEAGVLAAFAVAAAFLLTGRQRRAPDIGM